MAQVSLYLDNASMGVLRERSARVGVSLSKFVSQLLADRLASTEDDWPAGYWDSVYGCLAPQECALMLPDKPLSCLDDTLDDACAWFAAQEVNNVSA